MLWSSLLFTAAVSALTPITRKGNAFFAGDERFYVRGVTIQIGGQSALNPDFLLDEAVCRQHIPAIKELGANAIRVYTVDNSQNHDACMKILDDNGIYLILDVNTPTISINREDPESTYNAYYLQHNFATIDAFKDYDNVLGFFAGNEVVNDPATVTSSPYIKAVVRDMKRYIKAQSKRQILVAYSAADVAENRVQLANYLNCGDDEERVDFYGINSYEWCGDKTYETSGYQSRMEDYANLTVPLFWSEYGCNLVTPRTFQEVETIYGNPDVTAVLSGGLVYEWTQEDSNYGLVQLSGDGTTFTKLEDYNNLEAEFQKTPNPTGDGGYKSDETANVCPADAVYDTNLPTYPSDAEKYIADGAGPGTGINGDGSSSKPSSGSAGQTTTAKTSSGPTGSSSGSTESSIATRAPASYSNTIAYGVIALGAMTFGSVLFI